MEDISIKISRGTLRIFIAIGVSIAIVVSFLVGISLGGRLGKKAGYKSAEIEAVVKLDRETKKAYDKGYKEGFVDGKRAYCSMANKTMVKWGLSKPGRVFGVKEDIEAAQREGRQYIPAGLDKMPENNVGLQDVFELIKVVGPFL